MTDTKSIKICKICKETKSLDCFAFADSRKTSFRTECKDCFNARRRNAPFNYESLTERSINTFISSIHFTDYCWIWLAGRVNGYGSLSVGYKTVFAHRFSYLFHFKELDDNLHVCHTCDNPICVNPDHFFLGTDKDNSDDKVAKGRNKKGENHWNCRLKESDVKGIKQLLKTSGLSVKQISKKLNIPDYLIYDIKRESTWKHVE